MSYSKSLELAKESKKELNNADSTKAFEAQYYLSKAIEIVEALKIEASMKGRSISLMSHGQQTTKKPQLL